MAKKRKSSRKSSGRKTRSGGTRLYGLLKLCALLTFVVVGVLFCFRFVYNGLTVAQRLGFDGPVAEVPAPPIKTAKRRAEEKAKAKEELKKSQERYAEANARFDRWFPPVLPPAKRGPPTARDEESEQASIPAPPAGPPSPSSAPAPRPKAMSSAPNALAAKKAATSANPAAPPLAPRKKAPLANQLQSLYKGLDKGSTPRGEANKASPDSATRPGVSSKTDVVTAGEANSPDRGGGQGLDALVGSQSR